MADYGLNFGFRRSGGDAAVREGRFKVPASGDFYQGDLVTIDAANPGFIKKATAGAAIVPGVTGLLVQEFELDSIYLPPGDLDSHTRGKAKNTYLCTIWSGAGIKVWLKNTPSQTRWDGRSIAARTVVDLTGVGLLDDLEWDGTAWEKKTTGAAALRVTIVDGPGGYAEAVTIA